MNTNLLTTLISIAVIVLIVAILIAIIVKKVKELSKNMFGTESFSQGVKEQKQKLSETPRSLHAMTSVYLPEIKKDFPQFDYDLYKHKTESLLRSYFSALSAKKVSLLNEECSSTLKNNVKAIVENFESSNTLCVFENVIVYNTEISRYIKNGSTVTILFVTSVSYLGYTQDNNDKVISGDNEIRTQTVYETELVYVQNANNTNTSSDAIGITCPNCGAPITNLGNKVCEYCGTAITEVNIRAWKFDSIKEQTVAKRMY